MIWNDPITVPPPERTDVLIYTEENRMKVARVCRGKWDTYVKVMAWTELPDKPKINTEVPKRKKNNKEN